MTDARPSSVHLQSLPAAETLKQAAKLPVFDGEGKEVDFGSIFGDAKETVVVFIRHFFCGSCQQYVNQLATVREEALDWAGAKIVLVGCGDWQLIKNYCETTGFKSAVYADPQRGLYRAFGLIENLKSTPSGQEKRSYIKQSLIGTTLRSIWYGPMKNPLHVGKQGNISQLGADFIFGPRGETCLFASPMQHTEDHVEVAELMREAGVAYP